ncbi:MAG: hypothetical protein Q8K72_10020, partial [Acidimicrobiales bacterium]|nr:hypothetical protein [Acidimicrobiales bacterium]
MGPLNLTVLVICLLALAWELSGLRPSRLRPADAPPPPDLGPGRADWQTYVLLPAPLGASDTTEPVDRAAAALLARHPSVQLVVIDRGNPGPVIARSDRVAVVHVSGPADLDNTAAFLNAGIEVVHHDVHRRALDPARVVVAVLDIDSRLPARALDLVVEALQDPSLGAVQLATRPTRRAVTELSNAATTAWAAAAVPRSRPSWFGAPSHAPIGHAYRLSALTKVDERPWWTTVPDAQTDLALSLHVDGWRLVTTDDVVVVSPPEHRLLETARIRTRALHAGLQATARLGELWHSKEIANDTLVRVTARIVSHWLLTLGS